jgi:hypothetical protein
MENKKILTVSYGTFSCTLEGFDDSFETMKAIAEYFRDIAAEDRYFGAEPPKLDADMLARVAGPDGARRGRRMRVTEHWPEEANDPDTSAARGPRSGAQTGPAPTARPAPAALIGDRALAERASAFFAQSPMASPSDADPDDSFDLEDAPQAATAEGDTIAAKLARIRAVVARHDLPEFNDEDVSVDRSPWRYGSIGAAQPSPGRAEGVHGRREDDAQTEDEALIDPDDDALHDILDRIAAAGAGDAKGESDARPDDDYSAARRDAARTEDLAASSPAADVPDEAGQTGGDGVTPGEARLLRLDRADLVTAPSPAAPKGVHAEQDGIEPSPETESTARRRTLRNSDPEAAGDLSRLMEEADEQMAEPEAATRRSAFAHLRAAVAARFADRSISQDQMAKAAENTRTFKSDLADVVEREKATIAPAGAQPATHKGSRLAPLKLVAAQRVDLSTGTQGTTGQRQALGDANKAPVGVADPGFAAYAQRVGARTLADLLEAAASHFTFVEAAPEFSRPQLIARVREVEDFGREETLRCFGQLLRSGKIVKTEGGRFTAAADIGFRPTARAAG